MKNKLVRIFILLMLMFFSCLMQSKVNAQIVNDKQNKSVLIDGTLPSVYVQFEQSGKKESLRTRESNERVWLKLHNNTKWEIAFCSFGVEKELGDIGIVYDVMRMPRSKIGEIVNGGEIEFDDPQAPQLPNYQPSKEKIKEIKKDETKIPQGYSTGDTCTPFYLKSGKSVVFSFPIEHLAEELFINISFWYEWENRDNKLGSRPQTSVNFAHREMPFEERARANNLRKQSQIGEKND